MIRQGLKDALQPLLWSAAGADRGCASGDDQLTETPCRMGPLGPMFTDFYELTMIAGYHAKGMRDQPAVFEYFFRRLPEHTGFAVFAGLEDLLRDLSDFSFSDSDIGYLESLGVFTADFLADLHGFRFTGDVWSPPEGTPVFPYEPIVRVQAPLWQAQAVETLVLNRLNYQTLIATKGSRIKHAAGSDPVMEFGLRRAQGPDGGMSGTRAAIIGGCDSTSNTLAGKCLGIRVVGTQAHSWIMAFDSEIEAFRAYVSTFPEHPIVLVDTYDTLASGMPNAVRVFEEMRSNGWTGRAGVRIDSGDQARLSKEAYRMLVEAGFEDPLIVGSSDLDEYLIAEIRHQGARINTWGVGTKLMTGGAESALNGVYKLSAIRSDSGWQARLKISDNPEKMTDPGVKMPVRFYDPDGFMAGDILFDDEDHSWQQGEATGNDRLTIGQIRLFPAEYPREPLLSPVMLGGKRQTPPTPVPRIREHALEQMEHIRPETRRLVNPQTYRVGLSTRLAESKRAAIEEFWRTHPKER